MTAKKNEIKEEAKVKEEISEPVEKEEKIEKYHLSKMPITELNAFYDSCLNMVKYYNDQYQLTKNGEYSKRLMKYSNIFQKLLDEYEKRFSRLCE